MRDFAHLHLHTEYSLLDGAARIDRLFDACKKKNIKAVAMTDHGNMYATIKFYNAAKKAGIKPIIGCEFYTCQDMHDKKTKGDFFHLVLLAKNQKGYENIIKLDSLAFVEGFYYKPRIDIELLKQHTEGVVCLSACLAGAIPSLLMENNYEGAKAYAKMFQDMFGEDFYIELQDHGIREQKQVNPLLVKIAKELNIQTVVTNDVHYIEKEDAEMHDVLLCIQTAKNIDDPNRMRFEGSEFYLKDGDQMQALFPNMPEVVDNTLKIADKCNFDVKFKQDLIPNYVPENGMSPREFLRDLAYKGLHRRYATITDEITTRLEYELGTIDKMGFNEYYLIVWDFINYAKNHDIPVGPGRGSGVGSIVAYCVGITNVEPLRYNLLFERFLNPERTSMPDFDIDFCYERRGEVIEYVIRKYGKDKVCQIVTFGTMAAKAAIKDVARVYSIPFAEVNKITKAMQFGSISEQFNIGEFPKGNKNAIPELIEMYATDETVKKIVDMAIRLEDMPRNTSKHAAGVVICKHVISDFVPQQVNENDVTTQFDMKEVEKVGMLKMDFLGLRTLTDIKKAIQYVKEDKGIDIDFEKLGYEDKGVYELISSGQTDAVFQLESAGMKRFMSQLKPDRLEEVIAGISLFRPGPMDSIPDFIKGKKDPSAIVYSHPILKDILEVTYGCMVYQEQVMQIVRAMAGYSMGQADIIRRAMSKKDAKEMAIQREKFIRGDKDKDGNVVIEGAIARGISEKIAIDIFDRMEKFAEYAFNKSHAAGYAVLAYQTAYLKKYHLVEFITAVLNNRITDIDEITKYINFCREQNIEVYPPSINESKQYFSVENGGIRFALQAVKNCGEQAAKNIVESRQNGKFESLNDFFAKVDINYFNKRTIDSLIKAGAFDCLGKSRATYIQNFEQSMEKIAKDNKIFKSGQFSFFEKETDDVTDYFKDIKEFPNKTKLMLEKEVLGLYLTGHPLAEYKRKFDTYNFHCGQALSYETDEFTGKKEYTEIENDQRVTFGGMLFDVKKRITKNGQEMASAKLEDLTGIIELIIFSKAYEKCKSKLFDDTSVTVVGKISLREDETPKVVVDDIRPWEDEKDDLTQIVEEVVEYPKLFLRFSNDKYEKICNILDTYPGKSEVRAFIDGKKYKLSISVEKCKQLETELLGIIEKEDINWK